MKKIICAWVIISLLVTIPSNKVVLVNAAIDYTAEANNGFQINKETNKQARWEEKVYQKHYDSGHLLYTTYLYYGYSEHKGYVNINKVHTYHDDVMTKVEVVPTTYMASNGVVKLKFQGYPEYISITHSLPEYYEIAEYSPKNSVKMQSYNAGISAGISSDGKTNFGVNAVATNITKKSLEIDVYKKSLREIDFSYNYVSTKGPLVDINLSKYVYRGSEQYNAITVRRRPNHRKDSYKDEINIYATGGYSWGLYAYHAGDTCNKKYKFVINK